MLIAVLLIAPLLWLAQDTTVTDTTASNGVAGPLGFISQYVMAAVVPLVVSFLVKKWNTSGLTWYSRLPNAAKMAVYVGIAVVFMYLFQFLGIKLRGEDVDLFNLGDLISKAIYALAGTLFVKIGIQTAREKGTAPPRAARTSRPRPPRTPVADDVGRDLNPPSSSR